MTKKTTVLFVFATEAESIPFKKHIEDKGISLSENNIFFHKNIQAEIFISGIGVPASVYALTKKLCTASYDFIINAGIGGSFNRRLKIGDCVQISCDEFADLGITLKNGKFQNLFDAKLANANSRPFKKGKLYNLKSFGFKANMPQATGITVNTVSGSKAQIAFRKEKFAADIESMEGAGIHYVCLSENIPFLQIRAVSNKVEERNKDQWNIPLALQKLAEALFKIIQDNTAQKTETDKK